MTDNQAYILGFAIFGLAGAVLIHGALVTGSNSTIGFTGIIFLAVSFIAFMVNAAFR